MITFKNEIDVTLKKFPKTPLEWSTKPIIVFTIAEDKEIKPKDRIFCAQKMLTVGPNTGSIKDIYYYIDEIQSETPNLLIASTKDITAKALRLEL